MRNARFVLLAALVPAALPACGGDGQIAGSVLLTVRFADEVPEATIDKTHGLHIAVSGAETYATDELVTTQLQGHGIATVRYRPKASSGTLNFDVTARDVGGNTVGEGSASATIDSGSEVMVTVLLHAGVVGGDMGAGDLAMADLSMRDGGVADLSTAPDLAMPDLAMADLSMPDLAMPDLAMFDLNKTDLSMPDLAMPDFAMPDLTPPPDLLPPPDLKPMCTVDGNCATNQYCSTSGTCQPKQSGGGDCTGQGDHACLSNNCSNNVCSHCPKDQVYVPSGSFTMGSTVADTLADADEFPQHTVTLTKDYCADKDEATVAAYRACITSGACTAVFTSTDNGECTYTTTTGTQESYPINCLTWAQAQTFCGWAGDGTYHALGARRLMTEAEWERQTRGTDARIWPWGTSTVDCSHANYAGCTSTTPHAEAVGLLTAGASATGGLDTGGNVYEWVSDYYSATYYNDACASGCTDPTGPSTSTTRVRRGGAWSVASQYSRAANRASSDPAMAYTDVGVRCAGPTY